MFNPIYWISVSQQELIAHGLWAAQLPISAQQLVSFPLVLIQLWPASLPMLPHPSPCPYQPTVRSALFYLTFKFRSCHQRIRNRLNGQTRAARIRTGRKVCTGCLIRESESMVWKSQWGLYGILSWHSALLFTTWPQIKWDNAALGLPQKWELGKIREITSSNNCFY